MDPELKLDSQIDKDDPGVYHLTADRDIGGPGAVQPLMQRILGIPGVNGVRLSGKSTITIERMNGEDWQGVAKTIEEMFRDHFKGKGDARQKGPKGHTRFGATLENLWGYFRQCDRFAVKKKGALQREQKYALWALGCSAVFGLFCAEKFLELAFGLLAGLSMAAGTYFKNRSSSPEREHQWVRARALAEDTKSEAIKFLVRADPYDKEDAVQRLAERAAKVRQDMTDIGEFEDLDKAQRLQGLPKDWLSMDDYLLERVKDQSDWYGRKSRQHHKEAERLKRLVIFFGIAAAALGTTQLVAGQLPTGSPLNEANKYAWDQFEVLLRAWNMASVADAVKERQPLVIALVRALKLLGSASLISTLGTLTTVVTTYQAQNRLDFVSLVYKRTRGKLEALLAEWTDQVKDFEKPVKLSEYVDKFERILNQEHAQWIAEFDQGTPGGGMGDMQAPPGVM